MAEHATGSLLSAELQAAVGRRSEPRRELVSRRDIRHYAAATRQRDPRYLAGDEAPPLFYTALFWPEAPLDQLRADGLTRDELVPPLPLPRVMAGGVSVRFERPIRPGDQLVAHRTLKRIREKSGRSGPLIFVEVEMSVETEAGELVLTEITTRIAR